MKLVLDFDGVLYDTAYEAYLISKATYEKIYNLKCNIKYRDFLLFRHQVGPAWNYKYVLDSICKYGDNGINYYINERDNADIFSYSLFETEFFLERDKIKNENFNKWVALNKQFPFIKELVGLDLNLDDVYIVSTKDKKSILDILSFYGDLRVPAKNIFGSTDYQKYQKKSTLIKSEILTKETLIFIDDLSEHLTGFENYPQVKTIYPSWGYIYPVSTDSMNLRNVIQLIASYV